MMRFLKRTGLIAAAAAFAILFLLFTTARGGSDDVYGLTDFHNGAPLPSGSKPPKLKACASTQNSTYADTWQALRTKHKDLLDDKFT